MNNLAAVYKRAGRDSEAVALFEKVYAIRKANLPPDDPDMLTSVNNLAATYQAIGRTAEAIALFEELLALRKEKLGARPSGHARSR